MADWRRRLGKIARLDTDSSFTGGVITVVDLGFGLGLPNLGQYR